MKYTKPNIKDVLKRPDARLVLEADGRVKHTGPHIHPKPVWFKKLPDGTSVEVPADMTQPIAGVKGVGATSTEVSPPLPSDIGTPMDVSSKSLWGTGPDPEKVDQGQFSDCYYIAVFDSLLSEKPEFIKSPDIIQKRSDGKYQVTFRRNLASPVTVVVDGQVSQNSTRTNYNSACIAIFEKAYAYFRTGANTYASIEWGWPGNVMTDLGMRNIIAYPQSTATPTALMAAIATDAAVCACTVASPKSGLTIGSHCYQVVNVWVENGTTYFLLRNVWGFDGAAPSGDPADGLVTLTLAQIQTDISGFSVSTSYPTDVKPWVPPVPGDANGDGVCDFADFTVLSNNYGKSTKNGAADGDFNGDGIVNFADYVILSNNYNSRAGALPSDFPPKDSPMQITLKNKDSILATSTSIPLTGSLAEMRLTWESDATSVRIQGGQFKFDQTYTGKGTFDTNVTGECSWTITFTKGTEATTYTIKYATSQPQTNTTDSDPIIGITTTYTRKSGATETKVVL